MDDLTIEAPAGECRPRVSVIMAAYNAERFLREAVDSILAQTFRDFELLVTDDGSTDSTLSMLRDWRDPRLRILINPRNLGITRTLNRAIEEARGELIARMDADDIAVATRLEKQVAFMDTHPEVALVGSWGCYIDESGRIFGDVILPHRSDELRTRLIKANCFFHSAVMFRRQAVLAVGGYNTRLVCADDYDLWLRLAATYEVANLPEFLLHYRVHDGQISYAKLKIQENEARESRRAMRRVWEEKGWAPAEGFNSEGLWAILTGASGSMGERYSSEADMYALMGASTKARRLAMLAVLHSPLAFSYWLVALEKSFPRVFSRERIRKLRWFAHRVTSIISASGREQ